MQKVTIIKATNQNTESIVVSGADIEDLIN